MWWSIIRSFSLDPLKVFWKEKYIDVLLNWFAISWPKNTRGVSIDPGSTRFRLQHFRTWFTYRNTVTYDTEALQIQSFIGCSFLIKTARRKFIQVITEASMTTTNYKLIQWNLYHYTPPYAVNLLITDL